jgi:hypothetical protein
LGRRQEKSSGIQEQKNNAAGLETLRDGQAG